MTKLIQTISCMFISFIMLVVLFFWLLTPMRSQTATAIVVTDRQAAALRTAYDNYQAAVNQLASVKSEVLEANQSQINQVTQGKASEFEWEWTPDFKAAIAHRVVWSTGSNTSYLRQDGKGVIVYDPAAGSSAITTPTTHKKPPAKK